MNVLISVSDKSNLAKIAKFLDNLNCNIISTGGTYNYLKNIKVQNLSKVSEITNSPEILDGRVKTLHPFIHGGILAKRNNKKHQSAMNILWYKVEQWANDNKIPIEDLETELAQMN